MKLIVIFCLGFSIQTLAATPLKFTDTEIIFPKAIEFQFMAQMGAFVAEEAGIKWVVIRKDPAVPSNINSVNTLWRKNLEAVGAKAEKRDCKETAVKRRFICERKIADKNHYLSWSKKDIVYVQATGDSGKKWRPQFQAMEDIK